ncbi:hypothetical protein LTS08_008424 [Lithohypha guttulata]|nr:hypothetical protein LTS08_008424 [Lithohypha guttulata]
MTTKYDNVIVFGPTGAVGSDVALEASKRGAKVWLAMRDPSKSISTITQEQDSNGSFERIKADLSDPESVKQAVQKSGAKAAFFYMVHGLPDMKPSIQAINDGGAEYVVFLSSYTIHPDLKPREVKPDQVIAHFHAKVEIAVEEVGIASTMLRPGFFSTNVLDQNLDRSKEPWRATISESDAKWDCICQVDIGRVGGAVLVDRPSNDHKEIVYLTGPQHLSRAEMLAIVEAKSGHKIDINRLAGVEYRDYLVSVGLPKFLADFFVKDEASYAVTSYSQAHIKQATDNIKKYSGYEPTTFEEFVAKKFS